jgi:hypothetical protein
MSGVHEQFRIKPLGGGPCVIRHSPRNDSAMRLEVALARPGRRFDHRIDDDR